MPYSTGKTAVKPCRAGPIPAKASKSASSSGVLTFEDVRYRPSDKRFRNRVTSALYFERLEQQFSYPVTVFPQDGSSLVFCERSDGRRMILMIINFLKALKNEANRTQTENSAATLRTSGSDVLDLFASIGALRSAPDDEIITRFIRARAEDPLLAMKILFYGRDIRGGIGERRVFRTILHWMGDHEPESVRRNLELIPEYGRWDDLLVLFGTSCEADALMLIKKQLEKDLAAAETDEPVSLLGKWLPSINASNADTRAQAKTAAHLLGINSAQYRKMLSLLRAKIRILENDLRVKDYSFDYSAQPSGAMFKYRRAFLRNDGQRYKDFLGKVERGEAALHTGTLMPYEIVRKVFEPQDEGSRKALDVTWKALEDFTDGRNALAVIDGSGSMYGWGNPRPAEVALSLGIYFAERNTGMFRDHFITFSENPRLVQIKGSDICEKVRYCMTFNEVANTNIQKVFELILQTAVLNHMKQKDLPETVYIISDMEFDSCTRDAKLTNFEYAQKLFEAHKYRLPNLVFWNVQSRNQQQPVRMNDRGVALVSGASARTFRMAMSNDLDPYRFMMSVIGTERYEPVRS